VDEASWEVMAGMAVERGLGVSMGEGGEGFLLLGEVKV